MPKTLEEKTAEAILQRNIEIKIGEKIYQVAPPSTATLILVSEAVSHLPHIVADPQKVVEESLSMAKDCKALGEITAILVLGARHLTETVKVKQKKQKRYLWGLIKRDVIEEVEQTIDCKKQLAKEILETYSPKALNMLIGNILQKMEIGDFFGLTTFLIEINLIRQTKVETEATASGLL